MKKQNKSHLLGKDFLSHEISLTPRFTGQPLGFTHLASSFLERAQDFKNQGEFKKALKDYEKVIHNYQVAPLRTTQETNALIQAQIEKGILLSDLKSYEESIDSFTQALKEYAQERIKNKTALDEWLMVYARIQRGVNYQLLENWTAALLDFEQSLDWLNQVESLRSPGLMGFTLYQLGVSHHKINDLNSALIFYSTAWQFHENHHKLLGYLDAQEWALTGINQAKILESKGELDSALQLYQKTISMIKDAEVNNQQIDTQTFLVASLNQAHIYQQLSAYEHCIDVCNEIIERSEPIEAQLICTVQGLNLRGLTHWKMGELELAKSDYEQSLKLYQSIFSQGQRIEFEWAQTFVNFAQICMQMSDFSSAKNSFENAIQKYLILDKTHRLHSKDPLVSTYMGLASSLQSLGNHQDALHHLKKAENFLVKKPSDRYAQLLMNRGGLYQELGEIEKAIAAYTQVITCYDDLETPLKETHPLVQAHYLLGFIYIIESNNIIQGQSHFQHVEALVDGFASYDLACIDAKQGNKAEAIDWLYKHYKSPFRVPHSQVISDSDFSSLYEESLWIELIEAWPK